MADFEDDSETPTTTTSPVGERLRAAREEKGLSLEDIASQTRIPLRHLEAIEAGDWSALPAPTYTIGFAKSYASAVGLDRNEIGDEVRDEIGGTRPAMATTTEVFEPTDPARTMPKWLVISAIAAIVLVVIGLTWLNRQALDEPQPAAVGSPEEAPAADRPAAAPQAAAEPQGPVVLTATAPAWIRVSDQDRVLFEGVLQPGQRYEVPPTATAPMLRAGAPEALRVNVGNEVAPPVGPPGEVTSNVSLLPEDLMARDGGAAPTVPAASAPPLVQNQAG